MTGPGPTVGVSVFVDSLIADLGLGRCAPDSARESTEAASREVHYEAGQARRTLTFWLYVTGVSWSLPSARPSCSTTSRSCPPAA